MKKILIGILIIGILGAGALFFMNRSSGNSKPVAIVNGEKISTKEYEEFKNQVLKQQGIDFETMEEEAKKQFESSLLDGMISQKIIEQLVEKDNIEIDEATVETTYNELKTQIGTEEDFTAFLTTQNLTEKELKKKIKEGMAQEKYFEKNIDFSKVLVTDEEVKKAFEEFSKGQEMGTFDENKENIKNYLTQQKRQELIINFVSSLRKSATVEILLSSGK